MTSQQGWHAPSVEVAHSLAEALALAGPTEVFVIGGGDVYRQALPFADQLMLTEVEQSPEGDVLFPTVEPVQWRETARQPHDGFAFVTYERKR
jgi:dihydrofolate reductase